MGKVDSNINPFTGEQIETIPEQKLWYKMTLRNLYDVQHKLESRKILAQQFDMDSAIIYFDEALAIVSNLIFQREHKR